MARPVSSRVQCVRWHNNQICVITPIGTDRIGRGLARSGNARLTCRVTPHLGVKGQATVHRYEMVTPRRLLRFGLLTVLIVWFIWEIAHFPIRLELKAVLLFGVAVIMYIAVGELRGLSRRI